MKTTTAAEQFLSQRRIAVTGVSRSPNNHGANVVYRRLRDRGHEVFAVNPVRAPLRVTSASLTCMRSQGEWTRS